MIRAGLTLDPFRHRQDAGAHSRHLGTVVERVDRAQQRAPEGRARRRQRAVGVDIEPGAVGGEAGEQRCRHRASKVAAQRRRAQQQDFRLIGIDDIGQGLGVGSIAVVGEQVVGDDVGKIGAVAERCARTWPTGGGSMPRRLTLRPDPHGREIDL